MIIITQFYTKYHSRVFYVLSLCNKTWQKKTFKKMSEIKRVPLRLNLFFFSAFSNFFLLGLDGNRFRLADLGGVKPLGKLIRLKLVPGRGLEVRCAAMVQRVLPRANVHESCMLVGPSTRSNRRGRPTNGVSDCLPPSWTAGPRINRNEVVPRIPDIFPWRFFLESASRTCTSVRLYICLLYTSPSPRD